MKKLQQLMREIVKCGPVSKRELQERTEMSWGMVSDLVNQLVEDKFVISSVRESDGVGRKAEEFDVNPKEHFCIGVDVNSKGLTGVVTDLKGRVIRQCDCSMQVCEKDHFLEEIYRMLDAFMEEFSGKKIYGIGFSLQGIVDIYDGVSVLISAIENWENVPLKELVEKRYGIPTYTEHDPNCTMLAECAVGCLKNREIKEAVLMIFDPLVGAGMALITRGRLCHGARGRAGEIGCYPVDITPDGQWHHMWDYLSEKGILNLYQQTTGREISYSLFMELLKLGDRDCVRVFERLGQYFGFALSVANNYLNPEVIVLDLAGEGQEILMNEIRRLIKSISYDVEVEIILSKSGAEIKAIGGALIPVEKALLAL